MRNVQVHLSARSAAFLATAETELKVRDLEYLPTVIDRPAVEAERVIIENPIRLTLAEVGALASAFNGRFGMVAFECVRTAAGHEHPLIQIGSQLREVIPAGWPVNNSSDEADGTTKIRVTGRVSNSPAL